MLMFSITFKCYVLGGFCLHTASERKTQRSLRCILEIAGVLAMNFTSVFMPFLIWVTLEKWLTLFSNYSAGKQEYNLLSTRDIVITKIRLLKNSISIWKWRAKVNKLNEYMFQQRNNITKRCPLMCCCSTSTGKIGNAW